MAHHHQAVARLVDIAGRQGLFGALVQALAALVLDVEDARLLAIREPAARHQGLNL